MSIKNILILCFPRKYTNPNIQQSTQITIEMDSQSNLKRNQYAESIRVQQRQKIKRKIRSHYDQLIMKKIQEDNYDDQQFKMLKYECRRKNFQIEAVEDAIGYLVSKNVATGFCQQSNFKFIDEVTNRLIFSSEHKASKIIQLIKIKLEQLIQLQITKTNKNQKGNLVVTHQLSELHLLKNCFDGLLNLMEKYKCYHELWIPFSFLRNLELKRYSLINFQKYLLNHIENFESEEITEIGFTLQNYVEDLPDQVHKYIWIIDSMLIKYHLKPLDCIKLIDILIDLIQNPHLQAKISIIVDETQLIQNLTAYLDKSCNQIYKTNFELAGRVGYFMARMFSVNNNELCQKIYMKNIMILGYIRSWLPVAPHVSVPMLEHMGHGSLVHTSNRCTKYLIYALTNIVVSEAGFLEAILVKSDIYRAIIYMYKLVPEGCRQEISIFLYNMASVCEAGSLRIMLETKLPQIVTEMLKQSSTIILIKALGIISIACKGLDEDTNTQNVNHSWLYSRRKFQIQLENLGAIKLMDSLVHFPQDEVVNIAISALELLG